MPELLQRLQRLLNPRVVAVVGDQRASGYRWLESLQTFHGRLYSVQGDAAEIPGIQERGIENVAGIAEIPEPVDYVVCAVPPETAPAIVRDCIQAHVGGVALCTAGFAETADDVGIRLQDEIVALARRGGLPLLGPNCLGLHIPRLGLRFSPQQPHGPSGSVGFITQSGSHGLHFSLEAAAGGVYCSALIAYGNGGVLEAADFLDVLARDADTRVIGLYIEGTRDGRRLLAALRSAAQRKPVIVWKGGQTEAGARAALAHTASPAGNRALWEAALKQAGAVAVEGLDEMLDVVQTVLLSKPAAGSGIALLALSGGAAVAMADAFAKAGWNVPVLDVPVLDATAGSRQNPLDLGPVIGPDPTSLPRLLHDLDRDPNVHALALDLSLAGRDRTGAGAPTDLEALLDALQRFAARSPKPLVAIVPPAHLDAGSAPLRQMLQERRIPFFPTVARAATALAKATAARAP